VIRDWLSENERMEFPPLEAVTPAPPPRPAGVTVGTAAVTMELFKSGKSIAEIAASRNLAESTIESHLGQAIESGERLDARGLYTVDEERKMQAALEGYDELALKPVFEQLEGRISYGKLRLYRAMISQLAPAD
jgi:ATP-dependent DNA helicase RecQ